MHCLVSTGKVLVGMSVDIVCFIYGDLHSGGTKKVTVVCSFPFSLWVLGALTCLFDVLWEGQKLALQGNRVAAQEVSDCSTLRER